MEYVFAGASTPSLRLYAESWPFLKFSAAERNEHNQLYKAWNPSGFDASEWTSLFQEGGLKMLAFTTRHHEGFSMYHTKTRVKSRINWAAAGAPKQKTAISPIASKRRPSNETLSTSPL